MSSIRSSTSTSTSTSTAQRRRSRPSRCRWVATVSFLAAVKLDDQNMTVQCLLMPHHQRIIHAASFEGILQQPPSRTSFAKDSLSNLQPHHQRHDTTASTTTALHLFFDKFFHPYGVSNDTSGNKNNEEDDLNQGVELLNALLPRPRLQLQTKEEKSRTLEGFQRARLDEQLRLSKLSRRGGYGKEEARFLADDEEEVSRMADLFQRARLAEQLRLSKLSEEQNGGAQTSKEESRQDKDEAFQRALLKERLRSRHLEQHREKFVSTADSIEQAMEEYENEKEEEHKALQTMTMAEDTNGDIAAAVKDSDGESGDAKDTFFTDASANGNGNGEAVFVGGNMPVNETEDLPSKKLSEKLEKLHQMVMAATSSPAIRTATEASNSTFSLRTFLGTTHLPLQPREDASFLSVIIAPVAHLATSMFLLGSAGFYAALAVLDVIWNDNLDKNSTRACLKEASSVVPECLSYVFPKGENEVKRSAMNRTMKAMRTSCIASFYAVQCILLRAAKQSKYSTACMDAGTGALRYLVYAARSVKVVWTRVLDSLIGSFKNTRQISREKDSASLASTTTKRKINQKWKQILNPVRARVQAFSNPKSTVSQRLNQEQSLQAEQQRIRLEKLYNEKMGMLNLDRVALERDRQELQEAQRQLEFKRRQLLGEGVNVLAWYSAASEAAAATAPEETGQEESQKPQKTRRWGLWRGEKGEQ